MMNWNQNDTKYILKRLILYFIIAGIVFFAGHSCAKAVVSTEWINNNTTYMVEIQDGSLSGTWTILNSNGQQRGIFTNLGQGYVIFTILTSNYTNSVTQIFEVQLASDTRVFTCDIGSLSTFNDSTVQNNIYTVKCPVMTDNNPIKYIFFMRANRTGTQRIRISETATFVSEVNDSNRIIQANQEAINNQISSGNANAQAIQNAINNSTQQEITAINNNTTAINNQTTAINNQTDWFDQDYSSIIDTEFLDVFDDLFDNDDDVVRQFILIPLNFFVLIYNACSSNTCSPIELGELYGTTLTIPCINWSSLLGTAVTNTIDLIFAGCLVFGTIRMIKKMINKIMTLSSTITDECGVEVFK